MDDIQSRLEQNPIIAAVRSEKELREAIDSPVAAVFLLHADIFCINRMVDETLKSSKSVFIHIDFLEGLARDQKAVEYIAKVIRPSGIISTRAAQLKFASGLGLYTIQRFFLIDSQSFETAVNSLKVFIPGMVEIMPALMPSVISDFVQAVSVPVIAGGLIKSKKDIIDIIKAGALGASTGKKELWML